MDDDKLKAQVIFSLEDEEDFELFLRIYQIQDFINAINEILDTVPDDNIIFKILEKYDILKFFI